VKNETPMNPQDQFCPNEACSARGKVKEGNIGNHSHKERRYICHDCGKTFAETKGTSMYGIKKSKELFVIVTTLLAFGCPIQGIVAAFCIDERTVQTWLKKAGKQCQGVHTHLVENYKQDLGQVQADEIKAKLQGVNLWLAMALQVSTRLWLGAAISEKRDNKLLEQLFLSVKKMALCRPMVFAVDGFKGYPTVINKVFRVAMRTGKRGRPRLQAWPNINIVQVIKRRIDKKLQIERSVFQGPTDKVMSIIYQSQRDKGGINTSYIERLNATFRERISALARRSRNLYEPQQPLDASSFLVGTIYNFCTPHKSLRLKIYIDEFARQYRYVKRSPAIEAGITNHIWSVEELLSFKVPLEPFVPQKKRGRKPKV